ncbi:MAG: NAD(P)H-dependent oxidoreductase subunit E [Planctomycetes bacterium]|nr:NAD(P)H-dependent oxidoreductase subunit E [Planctomycetota bacterium]
MAFPEKLRAELEQLCTKYPDRKAGLIPALHRCQEELGGWISPEIMEACAEFFGMEPVEVYGVASFYPMFKLKPTGKHVIGVCHNISCDLRGADDVIEHVCKRTGAPVGGNSPDGKFTVEVLECQGACANAPMFDLDGTYHEDLTPEKIDAILGGLS